MKREKIEKKIETMLEKTVAKNPDLRHGILLVHSDRLNIHWKYAAGTTGKELKPVTRDQSYHIASIGKTFTSALIGKLVEAEKITYSDPIHKYLPGDILKDLHTFNGKSYSEKILIRHLLNHTSGQADYFEEKSKKGKSGLETALEEPDRFWTPQETIQWAKDHLEAHFPPGKGFFYSDTNYQLLGLIIENITGRPLHENLHDYIFDPLGMTHSYQLFYSKPEDKSPLPIADVYINDTEVSTYRSMSIDWAGGGIVSNTEDLLVFHQSLVNNTLLKEDTLLSWGDWARFGRGIDYGYGLVSLNMRKLTFILSNKLNMWGNWGSISTYMFYNPYYDIYVIGAFNQSKFIRKQAPFFIRVTAAAAKLKER